MKTTRRALAAFTALGAAAGCAGILSVSEVGYDAADGSAPLDAVADQGSTSTDAASIDAATVDAPGPRGCAASDAAFCADFDDGGPAAGWTRIEVDDGGSAALDPLAVSPPNALRLTSSDASCAYARPVRIFNDVGQTNATGAALSFQARLGAPSADASIPIQILGELVWRPSACEVQFALGTGSCASRLQVVGGALLDSRDVNLSAPLAPGWHRIEVRVALAPDGGAPAPTAEYLIDGQPCGLAYSLPAQCNTSSSFEIYPGLTCSDRASELRIDDVQYWWR